MVLSPEVMSILDPGYTPRRGHLLKTLMECRVNKLNMDLQNRVISR
jgi:hypothetical protein